MYIFYILTYNLFILKKKKFFKNTFSFRSYSKAGVVIEYKGDSNIKEPFA